MSTVRSKGIRLAIGAALGASMLAPATGQAAVTVGSNLAVAPNLIAACVPACTYAQARLPADRTAAGGVTSPVNGTVVRWRIRTGGLVSPTAFRVIRSAPLGEFTGIATSGEITPPANTTSTFPTSLPVEIGDLIGINCCSANSTYFRIGGGLNAGRQWNPPLGNGVTRPADSNVGEEITVNADIEPTATFTMATPVRRNGGKLKLRATVPNAGTLVAGDVRDKGIGASAAASRRFKPTTRTADGPGVVTFKVKPTKATKKKLRSKDTLKVKVKIAFTPEFGSTETQTIRAKIER